MKTTAAGRKMTAVPIFIRILGAFFDIINFS